MTIRCIFSKILTSLVLISTLTGCKSREEKFAEAETICFDAASDLLQQETLAHQEACKVYDNFILTHAKKLESKLPDGSEESTGITKETSLYAKDMWLENIKYFYLNQSNRGNASYAIRELSNDYTTGIQAARNRLAQLFQSKAIEQKYDKMQNVWCDYSDDLLNGINTARADSLHTLINSIRDIHHFYQFYQPVAGHRLGAYTCEFTDSIKRVNKRIKDYKALYNK